MRRRAQTALTGLFTSGLLIAMTAAATGAGAAGGPGTLDASFGTAGVATTIVGGPIVHDAVLQSNGDILVGGDFGVGGTAFNLARFLPNGTLDTTFGNGGFAATGFSEGVAANGDGWLAVQPDGKILWAGSAPDPNGLTSDFAIARFNPDGTLDSGFGTGGRVTTQFFNPPMAGAQQGAAALLVQPDGKILVGGSARQGQIRLSPIQGALTRLNPDGSLDTSFGTGGHALIPGNSGSPIALGITALGLDAAGDVFALPQHVEFSPAGQQDATVTPAAITAASHGGADAFLPSGQYVHVAFSSSPTNRKDVDGQLQRFNADGTLASASPAFDFTANESTSHEGANAVALQANGQAVVAGAQDGVAGVARFNADGSFDSAFGAGGRVTTANPGGSAGFIAVLVQPDGKILAAGEGNTPTQNELFLARYLG